MAKRVILNPSTEVSIRNAGSREQAFVFLEGMLKEVNQRMASAVRNGTEYEDKDPTRASYFRYLCKVRYLIGRTYPKRQKKKSG